MHEIKLMFLLIHLMFFIAAHTHQGKGREEFPDVYGCNMCAQRDVGLTVSSRPLIKYSQIICVLCSKEVIWSIYLSPQNQSAGDLPYFLPKRKNSVWPQ